MGRRRLLRFSQGIAEIGKRRPAQLTAHFREELGLLLLDVVTYVLDEHGDLGIEALVAGIEVGKLGQHPLDDVVLLQALQGDLLRAGHRCPSSRIEHLLLHGCVDRQLLDDAVEDLTLFDIRPSTRFSSA